MNKFILTLLTLAFVSGCGSSEYNSADSVPAFSSTTQPAIKKTGPVPLSNKAATNPQKLFMKLRVSNAESTLALTETKKLITDDRIEGNGYYRAESPMFVEKVVPEKIDIYFSLPPEVATPSDVSVEVYYGCGSKFSYDFYVIQPVTHGLAFETNKVRPNGTISTAGLQPMFDVCGKNKAVSIVLRFYAQGGILKASEQFYLVNDPDSPELYESRTLGEVQNEK